jgi:hypothetical protein
VKAQDIAGSADSARAQAVAALFATEGMRAPRALFRTEGLTRKRTVTIQMLKREQGRVSFLRSREKHEEAAAHDAWLQSELMRRKWLDESLNTVTTVGKNDLLDKYFAGSGYTAAWFVGLISSVSYSAIAAADTMASHAGWTEAGGTNAPTYTGNRPALTAATAASGGSKTASAASSFTFTGTGTIKGLFTNTVTTKDGTTGVLYNAVLFTGGDRAVVSTDVVNVTPTYTIT